MNSYSSRRRWKSDELSEGIWVALGEETPNGIIERTQREAATLNNINNPIRFNGPFTFDKIVICRRPIGFPVDILHNGRMDIEEHEHAELTLNWTPPI